VADDLPMSVAWNAEPDPLGASTAKLAGGDSMPSAWRSDRRLAKPAPVRNAV